MMRKLLLVAKMLLLIFISQAAFAQTADTVIASLQRQFHYYNIKKANSLMFVHLDKTAYVNNDMMWFTAYLLNHATSRPDNRHNILSAVLVKDDNQSIAVQGKFKMQSGIGSGCMSIPDTIAPGSYTFIAYTNKTINGKPEFFFKQSLTLKTAMQSAFDVEMTIDTAHQTATMLPVNIRAYNKSLPVILAPLNYTLGSDRHTRITGSAKTDVTGNYQLNIPKNSITAAQHILEVQIKNNKDIRTLHLTIPVIHQVNEVKFYPESGNLVTGMVNYVGWEAKTASGTPLKVQGVLYNGKEPVDTIETDSFGMGEFNLLPVQNAVYTVKLLQNGADSVCKLPAQLSNKLIQIHLPDALASNTLKAEVSANYTGKVLLLVHNYRQIFATANFNTSTNGNRLNIDLSQVPRGLNTITILDSLQRPCAERLFFAHYDQRPNVTIVTEQKDLYTRQKVNIKLSLTDASGKPVNGVVSIACVQDNRFEIKNDNNIENYVYLQHELDKLPLKDNLMGNTRLDRKYLNEVLLVRGWSRYKWPELIQATPADTVQIQDSLKFGGIVTQLGKPLTKPVPLIILGDSLLGNLIVTDTNGAFKFTSDRLYRPVGRKVNFIVSGKSEQYVININDPYKPVNQTLAQAVEPAAYQEPFVQNTGEFVLKGFEHATNLKEVKIKASNDNLLRGFGVNACGDYLCPYNILNCPNHGPNTPGNHPPKKGDMVHLPNVKGLVPYEGCDLDYNGIKPGMLSFTGIYAAKEFYAADHSKDETTEPDYSSTIYWKNWLLVNEDKSAELSFYTSDITGKFRIVVQGVAGNDVVYGEDGFMVTKK
jgi:hypothetical protein